MLPNLSNATPAPVPDRGRAGTAPQRRFALALLLALAVLMPVAAQAQVSRTYASLFNSREIRATNLKAFPKWVGVLSRYSNERKLEKGPCTTTTFNRCHLVKWKAYLKTLKGKDRMAQLQNINRFMNKSPYITDPVNYHVPDYWATPRQFFNRDGDCEDYAIAKFMSLRVLGFPNALMRIVVLQDLNLRLAHAVLVVYLDGKPYVLDNQIPQVVPASLIKHYKPYYAVNEDGWWLYRPK